MTCLGFVTAEDCVCNGKKGIQIFNQYLIFGMCARRTLLGLECLCTTQQQYIASLINIPHFIRLHTLRAGSISKAASHIKRQMVLSLRNYCVEKSHLLLNKIGKSKSNNPANSFWGTSIGQEKLVVKSIALCKFKLHLQPNRFFTSHYLIYCLLTLMIHSIWYLSDEQKEIFNF